MGRQDVDGWQETRPIDEVEGAPCGMHTDGQRTHFVTTRDMSALTPSDGRIRLVCHTQVEPGSVPTFQQTGFPCAVGPEGTTTTSRIVWTRSGKGTLVCLGEIPD